MVSWPLILGSLIHFTFSRPGLICRYDLKTVCSTPNALVTAR